MAPDGVPSTQLSVVIPARDAAATIADQLTALAGQDWPGSWEVVVADNGSTDETVSVAATFEDRLPSLTVVDASGRRGAAHARNTGARHATGRFLVFCDADDVVGDGWLSAMADALEESAFVAPRFDFHGLNPEHLLVARGEPQAEGLQALNYPPYLAHAGGSGLGILRPVFEAVGGFDETLRYGEDTDLCIRVQLTGTPLTFAPRAQMYVRLQRSSRRQFWQAHRWARHNSFMYRRYRPAGHRLHRPWRNYGLELWQILSRVRRLVHPDKRARWVFRTGWHLGLLSAAIQYRMPPMVAAALRTPQPGLHETNERSTAGPDA
jgi:GT2 family glycosyltransferase